MGKNSKNSASNELLFLSFKEGFGNLQQIQRVCAPQGEAFPALGELRGRRQAERGSILGTGWGLPGVSEQELEVCGPGGPLDGSHRHPGRDRGGWMTSDLSVYCCCRSLGNLV